MTKNIKGKHRVFKFYCNKGCDKFHDVFLFGTQVYHQLSSICKAAIHNGSIEADKGGEFQLSFTNNPKTFYASNANGLDSTTIETTDDVLAFTIEAAPPVIEVNCE